MKIERGKVVMNERIQEIISLLMEKPGITIVEVMQELSLTRRQINYAVSLINQELEVHGLAPILRHANGTFTFSNKVKELLVNDKKLNDYFPSTNRETTILLYLIINVDYVSLDDLAVVVRCSKTTILRNLRVAAKVAARYQLAIKYNRSRGYFLQGDETQILRLATALALKENDTANNSLLRNDIFTEEIVHNATVLITNFERKFQVSFSDKYFEHLKLLIQTILARGISTKKKGESDNFIDQTNEYKYLRRQKIIAKLTDFYVEWLALSILSANIFNKDNSEYSPDEIELFGFIHQMVEGFKLKVLVDIPKQSSFEKRLLNHLRPACYRVKYNLPNVESMDISEDEDQKLLSSIIKDLLQPIEEWLDTKFSENEIKLLTYYFGYLLIDNEGSRQKNSTKYTAVVVCSNGIIMSNILIKILISIFPEINFLGTMSAREFSESDQRFDVVFSTVLLKTKLKNYLVKPNMDNSEKLSLRYRVLKDLGLDQIDHKANELLQLVGKYTKIEDDKKLRTGIVNILLSNSNETIKIDIESPKSPDLLSYIKLKYIQIIEDPNPDWQDVLYQAIEPLIVDQKVEEKYYLELVKQVSSRYNYSFLGETMAIPHASPEKGILDDGIAILISQHPIKLPFGKEARILAPVAFFHMDRYLKAINQLANLATNDQQIGKLLNTRSADQAFEIIRKYVKEDN